MEALIANSTLTLPERLQVLYASLAASLGKSSEMKGFVSIPLTLTAVELASFVNASRQSVSSVHTEIESNGGDREEERRDAAR